MNELELAKMELDNHITGLEISKNACPDMWTEDEERTLNLMYRIQDILDRVEPKGADKCHA